MDIQTLEAHARQVRRNIITMTAKAGAGHPGGSLSCTDVLVALYFDVMRNIDPARVSAPEPVPAPEPVSVPESVP